MSDKECEAFTKYFTEKILGVVPKVEAFINAQKLVNSELAYICCILVEHALQAENKTFETALRHHGARCDEKRTSIITNTLTLNRQVEDIVDKKKDDLLDWAARLYMMNSVRSSDSEEGKK